jgi:hypothetical protein
MASPIARLFSGIGSVKRQAVDAFNNPLDYLSMITGRAQEDTQRAIDLQNQALGDPTNPLRITDQQAFNQLADALTAQGAGAGVTAYHGSGSLFRLLDPSKRGTGANAQAYGVGAGYTSSARNLAETYKKDLAGTKVINRATGEIIDTRDIPMDRMARFDLFYKPFQGYLYKGDIPDEIIPKFLDWNKPIKEQSVEVQDVAKKIFNEEKRIKSGFPKLSAEEINNLTGEELYNAMSAVWRGGKEQASKELETSGVFGIKYLTEGKNKVENYVPFRPEDYKIQEINDIPVEDFFKINPFPDTTKD